MDAENRAALFATWKESEAGKQFLALKAARNLSALQGYSPTDRSGRPANRNVTMVMGQLPKVLTFRRLWGWGTEEMSFKCRCCRRTYGIDSPEGQVPFFGVPFSLKTGTITGGGRRDLLFQKRVARAAQRHYEIEHLGHPMMRWAPWQLPVQAANEPPASA